MAYIALKKLYYTPEEAAKLLGVTRKTVTRWCIAGRLPFTITNGGHRRIPSVAFAHIEGADVELIEVQS